MSSLRRWAIAAGIAVCLSGWLTANSAIAQTVAQTMVADTTTTAAAPLAPEERKELEDLRTERRFKQFIDQRIANSPQIQDRLELEVDRAFARTTTLLNVVLAILTLIPLLAALGVWLLRRSVVSELVGEVRTQLEKEVFTQLKQQKLAAIAEIEQLKQASLQQVESMVTESRQVLNELKSQTAIANQEIELLKSQAASQLETMVADAQQMKDQTIQELTTLLPLSMTEQLPPDVQPRLGNLTALLESLRNAIPQITFTATDYLKQGNAFFFDSRYDDAITSYDKAIQLNPELYEAWFTKASLLTLLQCYDEAVSAYRFATQLKPESYEAWAGQGTALIKVKKYDAAISALNEAIALRPEDHLALFNRGSAYEGMNLPETALIDYEAALGVKPDFVKAHLGKAHLLEQLAEYASAIAAYDAVLSLNISETSDVWYHKAVCQVHLGETDLAMTALEKAVLATPALKEQIGSESVFTPLHSNVRFRHLLEGKIADE